MKHDYFRVFPEPTELVNLVSDKLSHYIDDNKIISAEIIDALSDFEKKEQFFAFPLDKHDVYEKIPELKDFLERYNFFDVEYSQIGIICFGDSSMTKSEHIHRDCVPENFHLRILWPVRNCTGSRTKIFKFRPDYEWFFLEKVIGTEYVPEDRNLGTSLAINPLETDYEEVAEFELIKPVVFNPSAPHGVYPNPTLKGYRVSLVIGVHDPKQVELFNNPKLLDHVPR